jgi:hypothetical protein
MSRRGTRRAILAALGSCAFIFSSVAEASAQVTIGQLAPTSAASGDCGGGVNGNFDWQFEVAAGPSYEVPAPGGVLTSWSTRAAGGAGQFLTFKILGPSPGTSFPVVGTDGPRALTPSALDTFPTALPVQAGDVIGLYVGGALQSTDVECGFSTGNPEDLSGFGFSPPAGPAQLEGFTLERRVNVSATVLLSPTVDSLATTVGPLAGGTAVSISGSEFERVTAVDFGGVAAKSFSVTSPGQITAVSPAGPAGPVPVTVTTIAGTSAAGHPFTYKPPPSVTALSPAEGPTSGGTAVTISGAAFDEATAVKFGSTPAQSFSVDSVGQITALSPLGGAGPVSVTVTTAWGTTTSSQSFTYKAPPPNNPPAEGPGPVATAGSTAPASEAGSASTQGAPPSKPGPSCKVPKLNGMKLSGAKRAIATAHCKLGTVAKKKGVTAKVGKVAKQRPKVGSTGPAGSKVNLVLG